MSIEPARSGEVLDEGLSGRGGTAGVLAVARSPRSPDGRALLHDPDLGRPTQAARIAWQLSHHSLPDGLQVLHLCDHPWCVRPTHLVLGSLAANVADRLRKQWVRTCSRPRHVELSQHDAYGTAAEVRARHRRLALGGGPAVDALLEPRAWPTTHLRPGRSTIWATETYTCRV